MTSRTKSILMLAAAVALMAALMTGGAAFAGDYHAGATLICSDCHVMHYSLGHDYAGGSNTTLGANGPHEALLKAEPNDLCLLCHDGQSDKPDVHGAHGNSYVREAGTLTDGTAGHEDWKGHTLGSTAAAPGGTWSNAVGLACVDCHHQHGSTSSAKDVLGNTIASGGTWRNLRTSAGGAASGTVNVSYAIGTNDLTKDIFETSATLGQIATHYAVTNVDFNEPSGTKSGMAEFCKKCHSNYHGAIGGTEIGGVAAGTSGHEFLRHPAAGVDVGGSGVGGESSIATLRGKANIVKVMSPTGVWTPGASLPADVTPTCTSCHKGHGNQNPFGLIYMSGTGAVSEEGDANGTQAKNLCKQCHVQG